MSKDITTTVRPSRRTLLKTVGVVGVAAAGGVLSRQVFSPAIAAPAPKIRLAWTEVAACHSPLGFGVAKGIYAKHKLDVELFYQGASGQTLIQALATGKADAGAGLIGDWLKPLEQGFDVKLFVGSHGGCQRLLASQASGIKDLAGVKGKTIATYGIGAPPQVAFQVTLFKAGIDPETDVTWKAVPFDLVGESVNRGDADLAAHLDPWAYSIEKQFNFTKIADTQTGVYENHTCCVLGANGPFLAANKDALRRLAEANIEIHEYTANHPDEVAKWYYENLKPAGLTEATLTEILGSLVYHNHPIGQALTDQIRITSEELKLVKVLEPSTDPKAFAERITVNLLAVPASMSNAIEALDGRAERSSALGGLQKNVWASGLIAAVAWGAAAIATVALPDFVPWGSDGLFAIIMASGALALVVLAFVVPHLGRFGEGWLHYGPWLIAIGVWLTLWELTTAKFGWLPKPFFSPPNGLLNVYVTEWSRLLICIGYTLRLWSIGFASGAVVGYALGVVLGWSKSFSYWGMPILKLIGPVPATAWIPCTFFFFPTTFAASVFIVALSAGIPIAILTSSGVASVNRAYYDVGRNLGASEWYLVSKIAVPASLPHVFVGLFMALYYSFAVLVVAEMLGAKFGLGWYIQFETAYSGYANVYATLVIMALICAGIVKLLFVARDRLLGWQKGFI